MCLSWGNTLLLLQSCEDLRSGLCCWLVFNGGVYIQHLLAGVSTPPLTNVRIIETNTAESPYLLLEAEKINNAGNVCDSPFESARHCISKRLAILPSTTLRQAQIWASCIYSAPSFTPLRHHVVEVRVTETTWRLIYVFFLTIKRRRDPGMTSCTCSHLNSDTALGSKPIAAMMTPTASPVTRTVFKPSLGYLVPVHFSPQHFQVHLTQIFIRVRHVLSFKTEAHQKLISKQFMCVAFHLNCVDKL